MKFNRKKYHEDVKNTMENFKGEERELLEESLNIITQAATDENYYKEIVYDAIQKVLEILFRIPYMNELMIPISFMESELGKVVITLKYTDRESNNKGPERTYSVKDIARITERSVQAIYKDVDRILMPIAPGSKTFYESEVVKYLKVKEVPIDYLYRSKDFDKNEK